MIIQSLKAECKYYFYELKSTSKAQRVFFILYFMLLVYCYTKRRPLAESSLAESNLLITIASFYLLIRMLLTGFSLPYNTWSYEIEQFQLLKKRNMYNYSISISIWSRIVIKFLFSVILNIVSFSLIMFTLNYVVNIQNYIMISILTLIGTLFMLSIGSIISIIMNKLELRREYLIIFYFAFLVLHFGYNGYSFFLPISVITTHIEGTLSTDILYSKYIFTDEINIIPYLIFLVLLSVFIIILSIIYFESNFSSMIYKKEAKKVA